MKIQKLKAAVAVATLAALSLGATAANAATANATARAKILRQITLANTSDLQFGTIVTGAAASTVAISSGGARWWREQRAGSAPALGELAAAARAGRPWQGELLLRRDDGCRLHHRRHDRRSCDDFRPGIGFAGFRRRHDDGIARRECHHSNTGCQCRILLGRRYALGWGEPG